MWMLLVKVVPIGADHTLRWNEVCVYGLVNQGLQDYVSSVGGDALRRSIRIAAGVETEVFVSANTYSDVMTYDLVDAASRVLEMPPDELTSAKESGGRRVRPGDRGTTHPSSSLAVGDAIR